jgi:hypothetical protein
MGDCIDDNSPALFLKTTDRGANWISVNKNYLMGALSNNGWGNVDFLNLNYGYFSASRSLASDPHVIYKTTDGGTTWESTNKFYMTVVKFYDTNIGVMSNYATQYRTIDGLNTMDSVGRFYSKVTDIEFLPSDPSKVFYLEKNNLFLSSDTGKTWQTVLNSAPENPATGLSGTDMVFIDNNHCWLLCDGGRVYYNANINSIVTGVEQEENILPEKYLLEQNYPNPFNPTTVIKFQLPEAGFVTLKVYDMLGREIKTLVNENKNSGSFSYRFDASGLASGVYLYELKVNDFVKVKKLVLLR